MKFSSILFIASLCSSAPLPQQVETESKLEAVDVSPEPRYGLNGLQKATIGAAIVGATMMYPPARQVVAKSLSTAGGKIGETAASANSAVKSAGATVAQKAGEAGETIKIGIASSVGKTKAFFGENGGASQAVQTVKEQGAKSI